MTSAPPNSKRPLRIGILLDSLTQPKWVAQIINEIHASPIADICVIVRNDAPTEPSLGRIRNYWRNRKYILYALYNRVDARVRLGHEDALEVVDLTHLLNAYPILGVIPIMKKFSDWFPREAIEMIRSYDLDVAVSFGFRILRGEALQIARHGVWSYHHGDNLVNRGGPAGFWEVMDGWPITGSMLQVLSEDLDNGDVLGRSWVRTADRFSVRVSQNALYWRSATLVMRKLKELYDGNRMSIEKVVFRPYYNRLHKMPTNAELLPKLYRLSMSYVSRKFDYARFYDQWTIAYRFRASPTDANNSFYRFKHLVPPKDKFWADPFPVKHQGKYFVFLEEYLYRDDKAHISVLEVSPSGCGDPVPVLKQPYHLSYPFVFQWNDRYFMIPETGAQKTVELYECKSFPAEWEKVAVLLEGVSARDATLFENDGLWWMFVAIADTPTSDELYLFYSETPLGPWLPHKRNPIKSDVRNSRPAGRLFRWNGDLYRPAQNSSERYGYGVTINRIRTLTTEEFVEEEVSKVLPKWRKDLRGTHTINACEDLTVIDCLVHRRR